MYLYRAVKSPYTASESYANLLLRKARHTRTADVHKGHQQHSGMLSLPSSDVVHASEGILDRFLSEFTGVPEDQEVTSQTMTALSSGPCVSLRIGH